MMLIAATVVAGCANNGPQPYSTPYSDSNSTSYQSSSSYYGSIESIQVLRGDSATTGAGAVVGGLVGGLLGNQVGDGSGRTAATVVGVVGGAVVGNSIEQSRNTQHQDEFQIRVHLNSGDTMTVTQDNNVDLRVGDRVRVADGRVYRY
jgi:outer membrane lipoprotein SlyB